MFFLFWTRRVLALVEPPLEVDHPVAQGFERVGGEFPPDAGDLPVKQRPGHVVQLVTHAHLARQRLFVGESQLNATRFPSARAILATFPFVSELTMRNMSRAPSLPHTLQTSLS